LAFVAWYLALPSESERREANLRVKNAVANATAWLDNDSESGGDLIEAELAESLASHAVSERGQGEAVLRKLRSALRRQDEASQKQLTAVDFPVEDQTSLPNAPKSAETDESSQVESMLTTEQIVSRVERSVALVRGISSSGTGFVVDAGIIATNHHVIDGESIASLRLHFPSGNDDLKGPFEVQLLYEDPKRDLALLRFSNTTIASLPLADHTEFRRGLDVLVIGNPGAGGNVILENAVSRGILSSVATVDGQEYYQVSIAINSGNSGGPVIDDHGKVVGVVTWKARDKDGLAFAVPFTQLKEGLDTALALSADDVESQQRLHRLRFVSQATAGLNRFYIDVMKLFVTEMQYGIDRGVSVTTSLSIIQPVYEKMKKPDDSRLEEIKRELALLSADDKVLGGVRDKLADLWANQLELKNYVDNPRGNLDSFRAKYRDLSDTHRRLCDALSALLGFDVDEK
jgi:serine protease Do